MNLPDYQFLPAPLWLITVLHVLTLALHFVAMNFMVGGVMIMLFAKVNDRWNHPVVRRFVRLFPSAMSFTVTIGVAPLLFAQLVYHRQLYAASIVSGWFWFGIIAVAMIGYYFLYGAAFAKNPSGNGFKLSIALLCFLYVSFVYSTVFSMSEHPAVFEAAYRAHQGGTAINPDLGAWILRWPHMLLGALTVGAFFVTMLGKDDPDFSRIGKQTFLYGMILTMLVGLGFLFSQGALLQPFMRSVGIVWLSLAIVLSLGALHFTFRNRFVPAAILLFVSILSMASVRHVMRLLHLQGTLDPTAVPIHPQTSVFVVFLVCFVLALGLVAYMLRLFLGEQRRAA